MAASKPIKINSETHAKLKQTCVRLNLDMGWLASNMIDEGLARAERLKRLPVPQSFGAAEKIKPEPLPIRERIRAALNGLLAEREEVAHWELVKVRGMGILKKDLVKEIEAMEDYEKIWITAADGKDAGFGWKKNKLPVL